LFALLAISLFFNAYLFARVQDRAVSTLEAPRLGAQQLDLTGDQALALESVRRFAEIRWQRRAEQRLEPMATLQAAVVDPATPPEVVSTAIEDLGTIDAQYRFRLMGELSKWSETLGPAQRARLAAALDEQGMGALVPHWE
jgi:hypothetical protein